MSRRSNASIGEDCRVRVPPTPRHARSVMASRADEVVTPDCIETFQRDGAVVLRGLLTPGEVEVLK